MAYGFLVFIPRPDHKWRLPGRCCAWRKVVEMSVVEEKEAFEQRKLEVWAAKLEENIAAPTR